MQEFERCFTVCLIRNSIKLKTEKKNRFNPYGERIGIIYKFFTLTHCSRDFGNSTLASFKLSRI